MKKNPEVRNILPYHTFVGGLGEVKNPAHVSLRRTGTSYWLERVKRKNNFLRIKTSLTQESLGCNDPTFIKLVSFSFLRGSASFGRGGGRPWNKLALTPDFSTALKSTRRSISIFPWKYRKLKVRDRNLNRKSQSEAKTDFYCYIALF